MHLESIARWMFVAMTAVTVGCAAEAPAPTATEDVYSEDNDSPLPDEPDEENIPTPGIHTLALGGGDDDVSMTPTFGSPSDPGGNPGRDTRIQDHLLDLIDGVPATKPSEDPEEIRITAFLLADAEGKKLAEALVAAHEQRHVKVRIVHDGENQKDDSADRSDPSGADLTSYLEKHLGDDYVMCKRNEGNRGSCIAKTDGGRMHAKFATFSKTNGKKFVSWIASANLNAYSGTRMFNNSLTVRGDKKTYDGLQGYFGDLFHQINVPNDDYYDPSGAHRGYFESASSVIKVHVSPEQIPENQAHPELPENKHDLVFNRLDNITAGDGCQIRAAQSHLSSARLYLVDKLEELGAKGCKVDLTVTPTNLDDDARKLLTDGKHSHIKVHLLETHDKIITVFAKWDCGSKCASAKRSKIVIAGSHNFVGAANYKNDELLTVVQDNKIYNRYTKHVRLEFNHDNAKGLDTSAKAGPPAAKAAAAPTQRSAATGAAKAPCAGVPDDFYCSQEFGLAAGELLNCLDGAMIGSVTCPNACSLVHDGTATAVCE